MTPFAQQIGTSLLADDTETNRRAWAEYIIANRLPLDDLLDLVTTEKKLAMRFLWLVGGICDREPGLIAPYVRYFFEKRHTVTVPNYDRSVAKMCSLAGIPGELEGEIGTELFNWLVDPSVSVSTKSYALTALYRLSRKHPGLTNELKLVVEDQIGKNSVSFRKQAERLLKELK